MKNVEINPIDLSTEEDCCLKLEPFFQCCCKCIYLKPVYFHCCTNPKPTKEQRASFPDTEKCVCSVQKGWACTSDKDRIFDRWQKHSVGCELYIKRE